MIDKPAILARHEFFRGMAAPTLERLAARARPLAFRKGQRIFRRGDEGHGLIAVLAGVVRITIVSSEGAELVLRLIGPDDIFGEIALLDGEPRSADATAATACELLLLERRDFLATITEDPAIAVRLLAVVGRRLRRTSEQLEDSRFATAEQRLAKALVGLGTAASGTRVLATQRELGQMIGLSRESTNRQLRAWQAAGFIDLVPGAFVLRDADALRRIADGPFHLT